MLGLLSRITVQAGIYVSFVVLSSFCDVRSVWSFCILIDGAGVLWLILFVFSFYLGAQSVKFPLSNPYL